MAGHRSLFYCQDLVCAQTIHSIHASAWPAYLDQIDLRVRAKTKMDS
jgi:hypothetical protein